MGVQYNISRYKIIPEKRKTVMKKERITAAALAALLALSLAACGNNSGIDDSAQENQDSGGEPTVAEPLDPEEAVRTYWSEDQLTQEWGPNQVVEHLFFHPLVCYPEQAFDGDYQSNGIDDWMVTVDEYNKILDSLYEKGYILVDMNDVWSETTDENGNAVMVRNALMLPEGKKPLIISYDDVNYYEYMQGNGFTWKLILGEDGDIWSYSKDPAGNDVISQDQDAITILDKFVREHPDFSLNGVKGCLCLTGYEGILGYRTNTDKEDQSAAFEENRQKEIEAVKPIVARLKETGWYFGSHSWAHKSYEKMSLETVKADTERWFDEVGSLVGETKLLFYPYGGRPDGSDVTQTGPVFQYLQSQGFRVFASVGTESYSKIKKDICAVICDRLHPDGTTLRWQRQRYLQFYDAKDIIDLSVRPQRDYDFGE